MEINDYIKKIKESISAGKVYEEYEPLFQEYIEFLKKVLKDNPRNIKAVCQLAIAYLEARESAEKSIELMEIALRSFGDTLEADEMFELIVNLAYFYEKEAWEFEKAKLFLEKALWIRADFPRVYNALGIMYLNENNVKDAMEMFSKAISLSQKKIYLNNFAVALYQDGQMDKAISMLLQISDEWKANEDAEKSYYSYGMLKAISGDIMTGSEIANNFSLILDSTKNIDSWKLAELYYVCKEHDKCIHMYENSSLYPTLDWLGFYFYSYYSVRSREELSKVFAEIISYKEDELKDTKENEDESITEEEKNEYIENIVDDIKNIKALYDSIIYEGFEPKIDFIPEAIHECYLIDCPRHSMN